MDTLRRDLRFAVRSMLRAPGFTLVAVLTLALGVGATTAIFSVVDAVMLRDLPYDEPESLVTVWLDMTERDGPEREWLTSEDFADLRAEPGLFEEVGAWSTWGPTLTGLGDPEVLTASVVTAGMFERVLRVRPLLGRSFLSDEDVPDGPDVVVLSHRLWEERYAADPSVLGRSITLNERAYTIVGVMPAGFEPPFVPQAQLWAPVQLDPEACGRGCYSIRGVGRLAPGVTLDAARARADALASRLADEYPATNGRVGVSIFGLQADLARPAARALWVLLASVGLVLLIACTNVANLLLARGASRESELAVRVALGAGRRAVLRQLMTESLLLATLGGGAGIALASWVTGALAGMAPVSVPGLAHAGVDARVLLFAVALTLGACVLFGLVPALRASRPDVYASVRAGRSATGRAHKLRNTLVVAQMAMAMVLLVGAGLLVRSFGALERADLGFEPDGVLAVSMALPPSRFASGADRVEYYDALLDRLRALPDVLSVGATNSLPLAGNDGDVDFTIEGEPPPAPPDANVAWLRRTTPGYFDTIGQRLLEGREFAPSDAAGAPLVAIVNQSLATRYLGYPRRNPVGLRVAVGTRPDPTWRTVVGVVADTRHFGIRDGIRPAMYLPYDQVPSTAMSLVLRTAGDPEALTSDARAAVSEVDPRLAASAIRPLDALVDRAMAGERFATDLLGLFAALALVLAAIGLYGVVSYATALRMREMGIRLALGAEAAQVQELVVGGGLTLAAAGGLLGAGCALGLSRFLEALLFGVSAVDPWTFVTVGAVLAGVALLASWIPARRLRRADPVSILRTE